MNNIDPRNPLSHNEFCELFEQLPLSEEERKNVKDVYWKIYELCLEHPEVTPVDAWLATRNIFIVKEPQIGERMKEKSNLQQQL